MLILGNEVPTNLYTAGKKRIAQILINITCGNYEKAKDLLRSYIKLKEYEQHHCFDRTTRSKFIFAEFLLNTQGVKYQEVTKENSN